MYGVQKINYNCLFRFYNFDGELKRETRATECSSLASAEVIADSNIYAIEKVRVHKDGTEEQIYKYFYSDGSFQKKNDHYNYA